MKSLKENMDLIEKIRRYRRDKGSIEILKSKNESLESQNKELKETLKILQSDLIDRNKLLEQIEELKNDNRELRVEFRRSSENYDFVVTTPESKKTVYGKIRAHLKDAKKQVLVCSPWITYLVDEFSGFNEEGLDLKVIINFRREDIDKGITDIDKIRALMDLGAEIRYNNNLHAKMVFIDSEIAIISSANLTKRGLTVNYEAGIVIKDKKEVKKAIEFFNGVWDESEPLSEEMIKGFK